MLQKRFIVAFLGKWRKLSRGALEYEYFRWDYFRWDEEDDEREAAAIPKDVPKGHMAVYVGEDRRRFVVPLSALDHPLFRALLDRAQEVYEFSPVDAKLCIPCDEACFLRILSRIVRPRRDRGVRHCL